MVIPRIALRTYRISGLTLAIAASCLSVWAQSNTGGVTGRITDASGGVVANASVVVINSQTRLRHEAKSNELGYYAVPLLDAGTYEADVTLQGFRSVRQTGLEIHVDQTARLDFTMEIGSSSDAVTITAETPLIETDQSALGAVVTNRSILNLPLNGRDAYDLVLLTPGTQQYSRQNLPGNNIPLSNISINGGPAMTNEYLLDGIPNQTIVQSQFVVVPAVDSVQEFKVQTNSLPAEFGRTGGGVINLSVKSGTNGFHGDLYEFLRNNVLDANNWFNNATATPRAPFRYNQFGATLGGPIRRDRTFFFFGYEGLRRTQGLTNIVSIPTLAMRQGDFSNVRTAGGQPVTIYDPLSTRLSAAGTYVRDAFPGNRIPTARFDPVVQKMLAYYPAPNLPGDPNTGANNFISTAGEDYETNQFNFKADHQLSSKHRMFARYTRNKNGVTPPNIFGNIANPSSGPQTFTAHSAVANDVWIITPSTLATFRVGVSRLIDNGEPFGRGFDVTTLGFPSAYAARQNPQVFPQITLNGFAVSNLGFGSSSLGPVNSSLLYNPQNTFIGQSDVTIISGRHSIKAGADARVFRVDGNRPNNGGGSFIFNAAYTQGPNPAAGGAASGNSVASFLLGTAASGSISTNITQDFQSYYVGLFVQDDFKVSPALTLNLGLRWEPESYRTDRYDRLTYLDFDSPSPIQSATLGRQLKGGVAYVGQSGNSRAQERTSWKNWGPRFGFAWQARKNFVVRGGYGLLYVPRVWRGIGFGQQGYAADTTFVSSVVPFTPANFISNPFPAGFTEPSGNRLGLLANAGQAVSSTYFGAISPYVQQWNVSIQRSFGSDYLVEAAYTGSKGTRLPANIEYNQLPNQYLSLGNDLLTQTPNPFLGQIPANTSLGATTVSRAQLLRPFPQFTSFTAQANSNGSSNYHALQLKGEKRLSRGFTLLAAYTFSKLIDDGSSGVLSSFGGVASFQDNNNRRLERAVSSQGSSQNLILSSVYELPTPVSKTALRYVLGGWQVNGIAMIHNGSPLAITAATNPTLGLVGAGTLRPDNNGHSARLEGSVEGRLNRYFDTSVFSQPAPWKFGNTGRTLPDVRSPGTVLFDLSLVKNTVFRERYRAQFRAEAFNIFNHPNFGAPGTVFGNADFGVIRSAAAARIVQMALKLYY